MDSIMQWTSGLPNAVATFAFALTFLVGVWAAAKFGKATLLPSLLIGAATFYVRAQAPALSFTAIASMSVLHIAAGCLLGLWLKRSKRFGPPPQA